MRIISGSFKGKKILEPDDLKTRPLKDLTKESIFNIISHSKKLNINLNKSDILDLFSGVGSFGIECLSRGCKKVTFIENYGKVLPILKKNLKNLKSLNNYEIIEQDIYNEKTIYNLNNRYDIIFLDPPYKDKEIFKILEFVKNNQILYDNGIVIIHRHKKEDDKYLSKYKILEKKYYGISKIIFLSLN